MHLFRMGSAWSFVSNSTNSNTSDDNHPHDAHDYFAYNIKRLLHTRQYFFCIKTDAGN
jgi:hypothetical protein